MASPESTPSPQIVRIPRSDEQGAYVLLHITRSSRSSLDLQITATEGENPYVGSVKQTRLKNFRAKNYQGSDDEWTQILSYVFGQLLPSASNPDWFSGVTALATISDPGRDNKEMTISVRKKIENITQRLGSITLKQDDEQAIELFDWSNIAVAKADNLQEQLSSLTNRCRAAEDSIQKLNAQLEELIHSKSQHENQLIASFVHLLNEKKLKIRNQQRLLASSRVDPAKVSEIQIATSGRSDKSSGKTWPSKRRARGPSDNESEGEDVFENMEVDQKGPEEDQQTDDDQPSTPQPLEAEEDTTTDEELDELSIGKQQVAGIPRQSTGAAERPPPKAPSAPPPRRELPFAKRNTRQGEAAKHQETPEEDREETAGETDDDEL